MVLILITTWHAFTAFQEFGLDHPDTFMAEEYLASWTERADVHYWDTPQLHMGYKLVTNWGAPHLAVCKNCKKELRFLPVPNQIKDIWFWSQVFGFQRMLWSWRLDDRSAGRFEGQTPNLC